VTDSPATWAICAARSKLFEQKAQLMRLLDVSSQAEGVRIFIVAKAKSASTIFHCERELRSRRPSVGTSASSGDPNAV